MLESTKQYGDILLVDDDPLVLMNYCDIIEDAHYTPCSADSVIQGKEYIKQRTFSLIVLDHDLPDGKGLDILETLKSRGCTTPVIYLSANAAASDVIDALRPYSFVKAILKKPVSETDLLEEIERHIEVVSGAYPRLIPLEERNTLLSQLKVEEE